MPTFSSIDPVNMLPYVTDLINLRWRDRGKVQETEVKIDSGVRQERCAVLLTLLLEMEPRKSVASRNWKTRGTVPPSQPPAAAAWLPP